MKKFIRFCYLFIFTLSVFCVCFCLFGCGNGKLSSKQKEDIFNGTYGSKSSDGGTYYGVGRTLNVLTDKYIEVTARYSKVFDTDKLFARNWHKSKVGKMEAVAISGSSMKEYYNKHITHYGVSADLGFSKGIFGASLNAGFGNTHSTTQQKANNEIYYTFSQIYSATLIEIDEYGNISSFEELLDGKVLSDAEKIENGTMTCEAFIDKYGTHAVLAGYYGGRVDCNYYLYNTAEKWNTSDENKYQGGVSISIGKLFSAGVKGERSVVDELGLSSENTKEHFKASSVGGVNFSAGSIEDFSENYGDWAKSMNDKTEYGTIVGLPEHSLVAIWDMFPEKYSSAKKMLSDYFEKTATDKENEFLSEYEEFGGGDGTESDPYIILNKYQFSHITNDKNAHYKLGGSIDLGDWDDPFDFGGVLDGAYYKITYTQTVSENKGEYILNLPEYHGGLFDVLNGATVKNLYLNVAIFRNANVACRGKVGGLAAITKDRVTVSRVAVSGNITVIDGKGLDYVGGLIGEFNGGSISECMNEADIENGAQNARASGMIGFAYSTKGEIIIENCYNTGDLKARSSHITHWGGRMAGGMAADIHAVSKIYITSCYNDSSVKILWEGSSISGHGDYGVGGIVGNIKSENKEKIIINNSYWDKNKSMLWGRHADELNTGGRIDMKGQNYPGFSTDIWRFSSDSAPQFKWISA